MIGAQLLLDLAGENKEVIALKRSTSSLMVLERVFSDKPELKNNITWVTGDLNTPSLNELIPSNADVYNCAGMVSFISCEREKLYHININGTANLINACLEKKVRKLVHVSSVGALGRNTATEVYIDEECHWQPAADNSDYAISKYGGEREVWRGIAEGLNAVIVNPSIVIGAGDWNTGSSKMIKQSYDGIRFYTNGISGYVDVKDVASIMIQLMKSEINSERFILSSENITFKKFFEIAAAALNKKPPVIPVSRMMSSLAWRTEALRKMLFNHQPLVTKYTAINAFKTFHYSADKIKKRLNYSFVPVEESIKNACREYEKGIKLGFRKSN